MTDNEHRRGRNIALFCDGTSNEFAHHPTNVIHLFSATVQDEARQLATYHPGLGTMGAAGALTTVGRHVTKLLGLAIGYGLERDVSDLYTYLMRFYEPGDRVFLFGFSRGAYTVRALAALVQLYGLMQPGQESMIPYALRELSALHRNTAAEGAERVIFQRSVEFRKTFSTRACDLYFVGVWDTVSSVGWFGNPLHLPYTANNPAIRIGRHAVAIDERRAFFRPNLWRPDPPLAHTGPRDLQQVWFHSDVGGGNPDAESGLAKLALAWMAREAEEAGLLVERGTLELLLGRTSGGPYAPADPNACMHDSLRGRWHLAEFIPKRHYSEQSKQQEWRMNRGRRRSLPVQPLVHESAWLRKGYAVPPGAVRVIDLPPSTGST